MSKFRWPMILGPALALLLVLTGIQTAAGYGVQRGGQMEVSQAPDMTLVSTAGCSVDSSPEWWYKSKYGLWSTPEHRTSGCGELTLYFQGFSATPNDCAEVRGQIFESNGSIRRESPWVFTCGTSYVMTLTGVGSGREARLQVRHSRSQERSPERVPKGWFYF